MMSVEATSVRKITISLPDNLVEFADREAARLRISRSRVIAQALADIKAEEEARLAAEGYRFYAQEASQFAEASAAAIAEAWDHDG
jgi:metal-responsive CopG/Arc/MetJ family transcriptional regulator